tara:strand:+ start:7155 stop:8072 length:918 start_codon:yes stop_codon:yes gene_type:complete
MNSIREAFGKSLLEIGKQNQKIVLVSCDLKVATKSNYFFEQYPNRSFEVGIAEANAVGISAGLALAGLKPVLSSFGAFLTGKNVEIRTSIAYNNAPVILVGTHGGCIGPDGATQSGIQDISLMRSMPSFKVFQPSTPLLTELILKHCTKINSPVYIRIARNEVPEIYQNNISFKEGDPIFLNNIHSLVIISSGPMVHNSIKAAKIIEERTGDQVTVVDIPTFKPFNKKLFLEKISSVKAMMTVEDHVVEGGLGSLIAESISELKIKPQLFMKGVEGFIGSGTPTELEKKYRLDANEIAKDFLSKL